MTTVYLEDQSGGVAVVLSDFNDSPYYPPATTGAAKVVLYARDADKGVDTAEVVAEGKPGGGFNVVNPSLVGRDMLFATVSYSANGTPSVSNLEHADWQTLAIEPSPVEASTLTVEDEIVFGDTAAADLSRANLGAASSTLIDGGLI
jgi:hypothetical protein